MNRDAAAEVLRREVERLRALSYEALVSRIGKHECRRDFDRDGTEYQVTSDVFWDSLNGGDVRVIVAIDDGGVRAFVPITDDFIKTLDGHFVGE